MPLKNCPVCGAHEYAFNEVIWTGLADEWGLAPDEVAYINRQQGGHCVRCGSNFRSLALAVGIGKWLRETGPLQNVLMRVGRSLRVLEINEAGMLTPLLREYTDWTFAAYPAIDIHALPYDDGFFDLVVHSDTLEHVANPIRALDECRRVLRDCGACCFTVPIIVGRMSRNRTGLAPSYHGAPAEDLPDFLVHSEFGADAWTYPMRAGFDRVALAAFEYPSALAMVCER